MKKIVKNGLLVMIICILGGIYINSYRREGEYYKEYKNYYNEKNINVYYEDVGKISINNKLKKLNDTYKLVKLLSGKSNDEKVLEVVNLVNKIALVDDVKDSEYLNGYDILKSLNGRKKISKRDMAYIGRDMLMAIGFESRIGILREKTSNDNKRNAHYVVEYFDKLLGKWILVDFQYKAMIKKGNEFIGSMELLNSKYRDLEVFSEKKDSNYKKIITRYKGSYSIPIDNTLERKKSNTYITYLRDDENPYLKDKDGFIKPSVFTKEGEIIERAPNNKNVITNKDKKSYIILMKKVLNEKESEKLSKEEKVKNERTFIISGFKNSKILDEYLFSFNNGEFESVKGYKEIELAEGENILKVKGKEKEEESLLNIFICE